MNKTKEAYIYARSYLCSGYTVEELEEMFFCEPVSWTRPDVVVLEHGGVIEVYSRDGDGIDEEVEEYIQSLR